MTEGIASRLGASGQHTCLEPDKWAWQDVCFLKGRPQPGAVLSGWRSASRQPAAGGAALTTQRSPPRMDPSHCG